MNAARRGVLCLGLVWLAGGWTAQANPVEVHVTADRVNLRASADLNAEQVGQVNQGDALQARELGQEWIPVAAPNQVPAWIHQEFIANGQVQPRTLNVRSGPGTNHAVLGTLERGAPVRVVSTFGEWLQIAPTAELTVFIHRDFVEVFRPADRLARAQARPGLPPATAQTEPTPPADDARRGVRRRPSVQPVIVPPIPEEPPSYQRVLGPARTTRAPAERGRDPTAPAAAHPPAPGPQPGGLVSIRADIPSHWRLIPLEGQGKEVEQQGTLRYHVIAIGMPTRHRLTRQTDVGPATICYLHGNRDQLRDWVGSDLLVRGREYWLEGYKHPVMVLEQISPIGAP